MFADRRDDVALDDRTHVDEDFRDALARIALALDSRKRLVAFTLMAGSLTAAGSMLIPMSSESR